MGYTGSMEVLIYKYYRLLFGGLMVGIVGLAFYVGMLEGKQAVASKVTLSCTDQVLSTLTIPTKTLQSTTSTGTSLTASATPLDTPLATKGSFAGSKNGTKYYRPGCAGLDRIKPENIIWFQNAEEATMQGYSPANC